MPDKYEEALRVLGLEPGATEQAIKDAYRDLVKVWHPDRFGSDARLRAKAHDKMKEINAALEQLRDYQRGDVRRPRESAHPRDAAGHVTAHRAEPSVAHASGRHTPHFLVLTILAMLIGFLGTALFVWRGRSFSQPALDSIQRPARAHAAAAPVRRGATTGQPPAPSSATAGSLTVASRPLGARLSFDGRVVGETPITVTDVTPGEHLIEVTLDGTAYQPWSSSVIVTAGQEQKLLAVMTPMERARQR